MVILKAAIFDMDGLLFDTELLCARAWKHVGEELKLNVPDNVFLACVGRNGADTRRIVAELCGADFPYDEFHDRARDWMREYMEAYGPPEKPGLRELFTFLHEHRIPLALATSTSRESATWMIARAGLSDYFSAYAFGNEVAHGKPAPDIFLKAAGLLGLSPEDCEQCAVFEDSPAGLAAASAAGMKSFFIKDLVEPPPEILATVFQRLNRLDEAIPYFKQ